MVDHIDYGFRLDVRFWAQFAAATGRPKRFLALHFAKRDLGAQHRRGDGASGNGSGNLRTRGEVAEEIGMVPIRLGKEQNGYVINTMLVPWLRAAQVLITNGVSPPEDVDKTWRITMKTALGPCGMMDMVGLETVYHIAAYWGEVNGDVQYKTNAEYLKANFVDAKHWHEDGSGVLQISESGFRGAEISALGSRTVEYELR